MTRIAFSAGLVLAGVLAASGAMAERFSVAIKGDYLPSVEACMAHGAKVLNAYLASWGGGDVATEQLEIDGLVYGWDLNPGDNDVLMICIDFDEGALPIIVMHSHPSPEGVTAFDRLNDMWQ